VGRDESIPAQPKASRTAILLAFAAVYVVWGSTYLAMRFAVESLPPFLMAGTRFTTAGAVAYAWARWRSAPRPTRADVTAATVAGALMLLGGNGGVVWAVRTVPSGLTALLVATVPLWMALLDWLRPGGQRPHALTVVSLLLGMAGLALLVGTRGPVSQGDVPLAGAIVLVLASLSWAVGSLYVSKRKSQTPFLVIAAVQMMAGGGLLLLAGVVSGEAAQLDASRFTGRSVLAVLYLILCGSMIGYVTYGWLLTVVRPALVSTYAFVNPVVAVLLGYALAGETLSARALVAGGVIVAAVALMIAARPRAPVMEEP
jgi:drug/metabolite transporter (DMT)-like permease